MYLYSNIGSHYCGVPSDNMPQNKLRRAAAVVDLTYENQTSKKIHAWKTTLFVADNAQQDHNLGYVQQSRLTHDHSA